MPVVTVTIKTRSNQQGTPYRDVYLSGEGLGILDGSCAGVIRQVQGGWVTHPSATEPVYDSAEAASLALAGQIVAFCPRPSEPRMGNAL